MRPLFIVSVLSIALHATTAMAQSVTSCYLPHSSGVSTEQLMSGGRQRSYRLYVPPGYDGRQRLPLVLDLHGSGGNAAGQARNSGLETLSESERFLVASLEAEGGRWNVPVQENRPDDVLYVSDVSRTSDRECARTTLGSTQPGSQVADGCRRYLAARWERVSLRSRRSPGFGFLDRVTAAPFRS